MPSSTHPSQLYNGLYRNISLKTTIRYEYRNEKSGNSVKVNENIERPNALRINEAKENEIIVDQNYEVVDITPVEETEDIIPVRESEDVTPVREKNDITPVCEAKETVNEAPEKKQQELSKEAFSMFNIFRRRK